MPSIHFQIMSKAIAVKVTMLTLFYMLYLSEALQAQPQATRFKVMAFCTAKNDQAHISFVEEAHVWLSQMATQHHFTYDSTSQ